MGLLPLGPQPRAAAQEQPQAGSLEPFLPVHHWTRTTLFRLAATGTADAGEVLSEWPSSADRVRDILRNSLAESRGTPDEALAQTAFDRFHAEYPAPPEGSPVFASVRLASGWETSSGVLLGGESYAQNVDGQSYAGPVLAPDREGATASVRGDAAWSNVLALSFELASTPGGEAVREAVVATEAGPLTMWIGRRGLAMGPSPDVGIVMSPGVSMDGGGFSVPNGFTLPGFLGALGRIRPSLTLARMDRSGPINNPWLSTARISMSPGPNLNIGLNRAGQFGGDGNVESVTPTNLLLMMIGVTGQLGKDTGFENQVASLDFWFQTSPGGHPMVFYGEWGIDDISFAFINVPAFVLGIELPRLPYAQAWSLGVEHARFAESCCGNPPWYRHRALPEGWTDRGTLLGHPLGGHGSEWALRFEAMAPGGSLRTSGRLFRRDRGSENLFRPNWQGASLGARIDADLRLGSAIELGSRISYEGGSSGWSTSSVQLRLGWWVR